MQLVAGDLAGLLVEIGASLRAGFDEIVRSAQHLTAFREARR
jgi:hypothetical protein